MMLYMLLRDRKDLTNQFLTIINILKIPAIHSQTILLFLMMILDRISSLRTMMVNFISMFGTIPIFRIWDKRMIYMIFLMHRLPDGTLLNMNWQSLVTLM